MSTDLDNIHDKKSAHIVSGPLGLLNGTQHLTSYKSQHNGQVLGVHLVHSAAEEVEEDTSHKALLNTSKPPTMISLLVACVIVQGCFSGYALVLQGFAQKAHINAVFFSLLRDVCCFPVLASVAWYYEGLQSIRTWPEFLFLFLLGATGMFGNQLFFYVGLSYTSANVASIFQPAIPVFTTLLSLITCTEKLPRNPLRAAAKISGILLATGGACAMVASKGLSGGGESFLLGNLCLFGNTMCMAVYVLVQKRFVFQPKGRFATWAQYPISLTAWTYFFGAVCMSISSMYYVAFDRSVFAFPKELWIPLIYAVFVSSALAYGLVTWANKYLPSSVVTAFWPIQVPCTVVGSAIFFQESLLWAQYFGACLIVCGLLFVSWSNYHEQYSATHEDFGDVSERTSLKSSFTAEEYPRIAVQHNLYVPVAEDIDSSAISPPSPSLATGLGVTIDVARARRHHNYGTMSGEDEVEGVPFDGTRSKPRGHIQSKPFDR